ncbi:MAG: MCE family protein [Parachlamydiaceae bacterium]|nr:MCE family protein [Parachlamydiaceae bacterium]
MAGLKNILIGVFVLIAFAIIIFILLFLHPSVGDNGKTFIVRFTDVDKVNIGTRVTYAGLPVGEVINIEEIPNARTNRLDYNGDVYVYQLTLKVDSSVNVYSSDVVAVHTSGLLGERNIEINPQPLQPGEELFLINNEIIYAEPTPSVEDTLKLFGALSKTFGNVLTGIGDIIDEIKQEKIVENMSTSVKNVAEITTALNEKDKWKNTVDNILTLTERMKHSWETVDSTLQNFYSLSERTQTTWGTFDHAVQKFDTFSNRVNDSWTKVDEVITNTSKGKGTIGRLFVSDEIYLRLKSIMHKGETLMGDINQYGLLYQNSKKWQRVNAGRMNMLGRLSNPYEFKTHFNNEMDRLSSSLSDVSFVMDDTSTYPQELMYNPEFTKKFSELIRNVEEVENSLKMYNEQVVNQECTEQVQ